MLGKERHKVSSVNKYLTSVRTSGKRNRWATRAKLVATTSTFPQLNHSIGIHGIGRGVGVRGRYQEGEECGVAESSATEEYFRVVANHQPALRPMIGGRRIPNSTAKQ